MTLPIQPSDDLRTQRLLGQVVEGYRIERVIGQGGMGIVYAAQHVELGSMAALKTLLPCRDPSGSNDSQLRFLNEARALSRVSDDGLVKIFNFGHLPDQTPYIIMELLGGQTLRQRIGASDGGRISLEEALAIIAQVAGTLAVLHDHGVIHRDLKPDNIMLVPDKFAPGGNRVKLLDFGIAKLIQPLAPTLTQEPLGTPLYMSPEGCRNEAVTGKADVYALGCVLFEMLCGRTPYLSEGENLLIKHMFNTPRPPRSFVRQIPKAVDAFVMQLLARDPNLRPMMRDIMNYAQLLRARPAGFYLTRARWTLQRLYSKSIGKFLAAILGVLFILTLFLVLAALVSGGHPQWMDVSSQGIWRLRSSTVKIPAGRFRMGSSDEELIIARDLVKHYEAQIPGEAAFYRDKYIGSSNRYFSREQPSVEITVPAFEMDRYEATNAEFAEFLNYQLAHRRIEIRGQCPQRGNNKEYVTTYSCAYQAGSDLVYKHLINDPTYGGIKVVHDKFVVGHAYRRRPVVAMTWHAAQDYCRWRHGPLGRLPTEVEWEYAARRGERRFPWGDEAPWCQHAALERCGVTSRKFCACKPQAGQPALTDVGTTPLDRSLDDVMDLGGSVSEWTADWFHAQVTAMSAEQRAKIGQEQSNDEYEHNLRVIRGGAWTLDFLSARGSARFAASIDQTEDDVGVRCVRELTR